MGKARKTDATANPLHTKALSVLNAAWAKTMIVEDIKDLPRDSDAKSIQKILSDAGVTYPYVLLTQVLGKVAEPALDATVLQDKAPVPNSWDARSLASKVVVPWNKSIGRPLGGSNDDPYVNNPARHDQLGDKMRAAAKNKADYDTLKMLLLRVQNSSPSDAHGLLSSILVEVRHLLQHKKHEYLGPTDAYLEDIVSVIAEFLKVRSNGVRLQAICFALFRTLNSTTNMFDEVKCRSVNAADAASKSVGDVECYKGDRLALAVEVKDRTLTEADVESTILKARVANARDILFLVKAAPLFEDKAKVVGRAEREYSRGISVTVFDASDFVRHTLLLIAPSSRAKLLGQIYQSMVDLGVDYKHVYQWLNLVKAM